MHSEGGTDAQRGGLLVYSEGSTGAMREVLVHSEGVLVHSVGSTGAQ